MNAIYGRKESNWEYIMKLIVVGILLIAAVIASVLLVGRLEPTIISTIESYGEASTGTEVRLRAANVSVRESSGTLSGLSIGNPEGYETDFALQLDEIRLDVEPESLVSGPLVLNEIVVSGATLNAEQRGDSSNLTEILDRMEQGDQGETSAESNGRIIIDRFRLEGGRITLTSELLAEEQYVDLPEVRVEDVGRSTGGVSYDETTEALLTPILAAARSAVLDRLRDAAVDEASEEIEDAAEERLRELLPD